MDSSGQDNGSGARSVWAEAARLTRRVGRALRPGLSPLDLLDAAPAAVQAALRGRRVEPLRPSPPPKRHWMYQLDHDHLLHVYGSGHGRIGRSLPDREAFTREVSLPGVPAVHLVAREDGRTWVIEDRLRGRTPDPSAPPRWWPTVGDWVVRLGGPPGPPLRKTAFWAAHHAGAVGAVPAGLKAGIARAWNLMGDVPARSLHGDVQPKNLLLEDASVGLVDWEGFWRFGLPGLDLVFLALMSGSRVPDAGVVEALARGDDPPARPVRVRLSALGMGPERLAPALLVMLSVWCLGEDRHLERSGGRQSAAPFRALLSRAGHALDRR